MNIYEKIKAVMSEVEYLSKDDSIEYKATKYKAISEEKVTSIVRNSLIKNGLVILPVKQQHTKDGTLTTVDVTYRIVNTENPEEFVEVVSSGTGVDTQDKGVGKAMTYAYKYMLLRTFAIPTGEDPDKVSSAEIDDEEKEAEERRKKEEKKPITSVMVTALRNRFKNNGIDEEKVLALYKLSELSKMSMGQHSHFNQYFDEMKVRCSI